MEPPRPFDQGGSNVFMRQYTSIQVQNLFIVQAIVSIVSVSVGILGLTLWFRMAPTRRMIFRLELLATIITWDFLKALIYFVLSIAGLGDIHSLRDENITLITSFCDGFGFVISVCSYNSDWLILMLAVHNALTIFCPRLARTYKRRVLRWRVVFHNMQKVLILKLLPTVTNVVFPLDGPQPRQIYIKEGGVFRFRFYIGAVFYSCSLIFSGLAFLNNSHYNADFACTVPVYPIWLRIINNTAFQCFNVIAICAIYASIMIYLAVQFKQLRHAKDRLYHNTTSSQQSATIITAITEPTTLSYIDYNLQRELMDIAKSDSHEQQLNTAMKELKTFCLYPIGYVIIWTPNLISQFFYIYQGKSNPYALRVMRGIMVPLSCLLDTTFFLLREKPWKFRIDPFNYHETTGFDMGEDISRDEKTTTTRLSTDEAGDMDFLEFLNRGPV